MFYELQAVPRNAVDGSSYNRLTVLEDGATLAGSGDDLKVIHPAPERLLCSMNLHDHMLFLCGAVPFTIAAIHHYKRSQKDWPLLDDDEPVSKRTPLCLPPMLFSFVIFMRQTKQSLHQKRLLCKPAVVCSMPHTLHTRCVGAGGLPDRRHLDAGAAAAGSAADAQPGGLARVADLHGAHLRAALPRCVRLVPLRSG